MHTFGQGYASVPTQQRDLAASFSRLARALVVRERPILERVGLSMWEYIVLSALRDHEMPTQSELARLTGHDKSRLVPLLDELERRGLLARARDEVDRRARRVSLTKAGRTTQSRAQRDIRRMESKFLAALADDERERLHATLARLEREQAPG